MRSADERRPQDDAPSMTSELALRPVEEILRSWQADPDVTIFCGNWGEGGIMELLPQGGASLSGPRYDPPFHGLRELRFDAGGHHVHLDLGRLTRAWYVVAPSVCYGFRPSFEIRLTVADAKPLANFGVGFALGRPYAGSRLRTEAVERYLRRAADHAAHFPDAVSLLFDRSGLPQAPLADWHAIDALLARMGTSGSDSLLQSLRSVSTPGVATVSLQA